MAESLNRVGNLLDIMNIAAKKTIMLTVAIALISIGVVEGLHEVEAQTRLDKRIAYSDFYVVSNTGNVVAGATGEQNALCITGDKVISGSAIVNVFINNRSGLGTSYTILSEGEEFDNAGGRTDGWHIKLDNTGRSDLGLIVTVNCLSMDGVT